jgi:hypothetical protein
MGLSNYFNDEIELQDMTDESLSLARAQRINQNTVGTFFNALEKVPIENNLSDTPGNIYNEDESGIQINNKPDSVITENRSKIFMF